MLAHSHNYDCITEATLPDKNSSLRRALYAPPALTLLLFLACSSKGDSRTGAVQVERVANATTQAGIDSTTTVWEAGAIVAIGRGTSPIPDATTQLVITLTDG